MLRSSDPLTLRSSDPCPFRPGTWTRQMDQSECLMAAERRLQNGMGWGWVGRMRNSIRRVETFKAHPHPRHHHHHHQDCAGLSTLSSHHDHAANLNPSFRSIATAIAFHHLSILLFLLLVHHPQSTRLLIHSMRTLRPSRAPLVHSGNAV